MNVYNMIFKIMLFIAVLGGISQGYIVSHNDVQTVVAADSDVDEEQKPLIINPTVMLGYQLAGKCLTSLVGNAALIDYVAHGAGLWHHNYSLRHIMPILLKHAALSHMHDELAQAYGYQPACLENHAIISFIAKTAASSLLSLMISQGYSTVFER